MNPAKTSRKTTGSIFQERFKDRSAENSLAPPFPANCVVELTNACNHQCVFCANPRMEREISRLSTKGFARFIKNAVPLGLKEVGFYATGEPFLLNNLDEFVRVAKEGGVGYVYVTTNGALATPARLIKVLEAGLDSIKFSINGATRETYKLVHGADDFDAVLANVRWLAERRKQGGAPRMLASCVLTRATEGEKALHQELFGPYFDDIMYSDTHAQAGYSAREAELVAASGRDPRFPPPGSMEPCFHLWKRINITAEGFLTLCCADYENKLAYARLSDSDDLMKLWHNPAITEMRRRHLEQRLEGTLCDSCVYGGKAPDRPLTELGEASKKKARRLQEAASLEIRIDAVRRRNGRP